jgi:hypothetical protein
MTRQCHRGGRSWFSDWQEVAIEVIRADNLMVNTATAVDLHFVFLMGHPVYWRGQISEMDLSTVNLSAR